MNKLTEKTVAAKAVLEAHVARAVLRMHDDERGQGTVEYVGAVLLVVAIVGIVVAASTEVGDSIVEQLTEAVTDIGSGGGGGGGGE